MPSDDLILNVRQIAGYPDASAAQAGDAVLIQRGGLGGPYYTLTAQEFVGTALAAGGTDMTIAGALTAYTISGGSLAFSNGVINDLTSTNASFLSLNATAGFIGGEPIATQPYVLASTVRSFNWRHGDVILDIGDIMNAGGAPLFSPMFLGEPQAPTPELADASTRIATTDFVQRNIAGYIQYTLENQPFVFTFNGRSGDVVLTAQDVIDAGGTGEFFNNPTFTGDPQTPTPPRGDNDQSVASTAFVQDAIASSPIIAGFAPINSPVFTGIPQAPTAAPGSASGQLATTAFVHAAVTAATAGVSSWNSRTGSVTMNATDITNAGGALLAGPTFTGIPSAPTATPGTNTGQIATTAFVTAALASVSGGVTSFNTRTGAVVLSAADITGAGGALLASPALAGVPTAPTAAVNTSTTQIATTAFVMNELSSGAVQSFNGRTGAVNLNSADISAAGGAAINSPAFTGNPTAPTPAPGNNSTALATTAFVAALVGSTGVLSFNSRTGAVSLTLADVTGVGGAPLSSPAFSGVPTSPTPNPGDSSQKVATTAFVAAALAGGAGVSSFNTRTGAVVLTAADISSVGGALLSSPAFTGSPTAPTPAVGTNSTVLATTAFVTAQIGAGAVVTFNGRNGAVTLNSADISAAGGAVLASPAFTGTPTAPTPAPGDNDTSIATTAFVQNAVNSAGGVVSFNGRAGAVTLSGADITSGGGALLASPAFTGNPTAPTATAGTNSTVLATTAFVTQAVAAVTSGYLPLTGGVLTGQTGVVANNGQTYFNGPSITVANPGGASLYLQRTPTTSSSGILFMSNSMGAAGQRMTWSVTDNETGGNAGSNLYLSCYSDTGGGLSTPIQVTRSNGAITMPGTVYMGSFGNPGAVVGGFSNSNTINFTAAYGLIVENSGAPVLNINRSQVGTGLVVVQFRQNSSTAVGSITVSSQGSTAYNTTSDERLKAAPTPVAPEYAGEIIDAVEPIRFTWRERTGKALERPEYGFSAQALNEVFPTAVVPGTGDPGDADFMPWMMDASKLVPIIVAELKDLRARLAALENGPKNKRGKP